MKHRINVFSWLLGVTLAAGGCAEILGLEPPDASSGGTTTSTGGTTSTGTGGTGGGGTGGVEPGPCKADGECPVQGIPECHKPVCLAGTCQSEPVPDGQDAPCYSGPAGTENVGPCKPGTVTCVDGKPNGGCAGEVTPAPEDCTTPEDEACDGGGTGCSGAVLEVLLFQGGGANDLRGVVVGPGGEVYVSGSYTQATTLFGDCTLPNTTGTAAFVARLSAALKCEWVVTLESGGEDTSLGPLVLWNDGVWAVGTITGTPKLVADGQTYSLMAEDADGIVVGLGTNGKLSAAYRIGGAGADYGTGITAGDSVHALVEVAPGAGGTVTDITGPSQFGYAPIFGGRDAAVVSINPPVIDGVKLFGSASGDAPRALASLGKSLLVGGGSVGDSMPVEGCSLDGSDTLSNAFVFNLPLPVAEPDPVTVCKSWVGDGNAYTTSISAAPDGRFAVAGYGSGQILDDCLDAGLPGKISGFLRIGSASNDCMYSMMLSSSDTVYAAAARLDASTVLLAGSYTGVLGLVRGAGGRDVFVHRYPDTLGLQLWHTEFGSAADDDLAALAVSPVDGSVLVAGTCRGQGFAGKGDCDGADGFLVRLSP